MKTIVDADTGEIVEVEETTEIVARDLADVGVNYEDYFEMELKAKALKEQMEIWEWSKRDAIKEVFKKHGIKSFKCEEGSITYVEERLQKRVDNDRLKQDGVYEKYLKLVPVKEHLVIKIKEK